jgi:hypothetical protein
LLFDFCLKKPELLENALSDAEIFDEVNFIGIAKCIKMLLYMRQKGAKTKYTVYALHIPIFAKIDTRASIIEMKNFSV